MADNTPVTPKNYSLSPAEGVDKRSPLKPDEECQHTTEKKREEEAKRRLDTNYVVPLVQVNEKLFRRFALYGTFELVEIGPNDIKILQKLVGAIYPAGTYDNKKLDGIVNSSNRKLHRFACYNGINVGVVSCSITNVSDEESLHIEMLGVLPAYRQCGFGEELYQYARGISRKYSSRVNNMYTYVRIDNDNAIRFFEKREFIVDEDPYEEYYPNEPRDAYMLTKDIRNRL